MKSRLVAYGRIQKGHSDRCQLVLLDDRLCPAPGQGTEDAIRGLKKKGRFAERVLSSAWRNPFRERHASSEAEINFPPQGE